MDILDARGLSCPEPVLRVQNALKHSAEGVIAMVDNMASVENIKRFASARRYAVIAEKCGSDWTLTLTKA